MGSHYTCHNCGQQYDKCTCPAPNIVPDAVSADPKPSPKVVSINPTIKPEAVHVDLRFDPGYPTDTVLAKASAASLKGVLLLGYKPDGTVYIDSNIQDGPMALWVLEAAKTLLMKESV